MKVLIVDDAPIVRGRMARLVGNVPGVSTVLQSRDYAETLDVMAQERPDTVLLDLLMPGGNGLELLQRMRRAACGPRVMNQRTQDCGGRLSIQALIRATPSSCTRLRPTGGIMSRAASCVMR